MLSVTAGNAIFSVQLSASVRQLAAYIEVDVRETMKQNVTTRRFVSVKSRERFHWSVWGGWGHAYHSSMSLVQVGKV